MGLNYLQTKMLELRGRTSIINQQKAKNDRLQMRINQNLREDGVSIGGSLWKRSRCSSSVLWLLLFQVSITMVNLHHLKISSLLLCQYLMYVCLYPYFLSSVVSNLFLLTWKWPYNFSCNRKYLLCSGANDVLVDSRHRPVDLFEVVLAVSRFSSQT